MLQGLDKFFDTVRDWQGKDTGMAFKMRAVEVTREVLNSEGVWKGSGGHTTKQDRLRALVLHRSDRQRNRTGRMAQHPSLHPSCMTAA